MRIRRPFCRGSDLLGRDRRGGNGLNNSGRSSDDRGRCERSEDAGADMVCGVWCIEMMYDMDMVY